MQIDRIHFYHIYKCGGRSLIFTMLAPYTDAPTTVWARICAHGQMVLDGMTFRGEPYAKSSRAFTWTHAHAYCFTLPEETFTITIFRDPVQRIASLYRAVLVDLSHPTLSQLNYWYVYLGENILDFVLRLPSLHRYEQIAMFSKEINLEEAVENVQGVSYYYRLDNFNQATTQLCRILEIPARIQYVSGRDSMMESSILPAVNERIEAELAVHHCELAELYECEYNLLAAVADREGRYGG